MTRSKIVLLAAALTALAGAGYWYHSTRQAPVGSVPAQTVPVPVTVAAAAVADIPVRIEVVGRAEAYASVTLRSRVDGQVAAVLYDEGQQVRQGEVLIRLDPGDFAARRLQAEANLARNEALLAKARADVERHVGLQERGFVSEERVNELRTAEAAAAATVQADRAALELARRQLSYSTIRAPFAGVVGARLVFPGSAVKVNETILAVVNRVRPLYVTFPVPEKYLPRLRAALTQGGMQARITVPGEHGQAFEAPVTFLDNAVDVSTGTIQMKALLDNREQRLTAGQFVNVSLSLATLADTVVVPAQAVQQGQEGPFVYVVREDSTVEVRNLEILASQGGVTGIGKGVAAGEVVVTDGQLRLAPGTRVQARPSRQETGQDTVSPSAASAAGT